MRRSANSVVWTVEHIPRRCAVQTPDRGAGSTGAVEIDATTTPADAVALLRSTRVPAEVENLVDELVTRSGARSWTGTERVALIEALVLCLAGEAIRQDADAEDAVCSALEHTGVMRRVDNLVFEFVPDHELAASDMDALRRYRGWLPSKYSAQPASGR
jgi:hypothetical protein